MTDMHLDYLVGAVLLCYVELNCLKWHRVTPRRHAAFVRIVAWALMCLTSARIVVFTLSHFTR